MGQIYDAIKGLITPKMIGTAAETLHESESNVKASVKTILPALLGNMINRGITPHVIGVVDDAGKDKVINHLPKMFEGHGILDDRNYGERMENALIGPRNTEFRAAISQKRGIKVESADRLTNWVSSAIAGYFGEQVIGKKVSMTTLINGLEKEKSDLAADVPQDLWAKLGLSGLFGSKGSGGKGKKKCKWCWLWWLLLILLLLALLCFGWKACERKKAAELAEKPKVEQTVDEKLNAELKAAEKIEYTLPNGEKITIYKDGTEHLITDFLNSERYKNATAADLRDIWFEFDQIDFEFNSTDKLMPGSMDQLKNLMAILKAHPNAKMKIGGYADATGTQVINLDISKARAEYIKSLFVANGLHGQISTEGFGEEFATIPENATNAQRAIDRHIALRFEK